MSPLSESFRAYINTKITNKSQKRNANENDRFFLLKYRRTVRPSAPHTWRFYCICTTFLPSDGKKQIGRRTPRGWRFSETPNPHCSVFRSLLSPPILAPGHVVCGVCASYTPPYWIFAIVKNIDKQKRVVCLSVERGSAFACAFPRKKWRFAVAALPRLLSVACFECPFRILFVLVFAFFCTVRSNSANICVCFVEFFNIVIFFVWGEKFFRVVDSAEKCFQV